MERNSLAVGLAMAIAFATTLCAGLIAMHSYQILSPIDELQHLDYVIKASHGQLILRPGETFGEEALRIQACRGIEAPIELPACDDPDLKPEEFQESGINTASKGLPSAYYIATGAFILPMRALGLNELTAARAASLLAHALGAAFVAALVARLSRSAVLGAGVGCLVGTLPHLLSQSATVNPDAWSLLAGATFVALTLSRQRLGFWPWVASLTTATVVFGLVKPNWVLLVVVPVASVGSQWLADRSRVPARDLIAALSVALVGAGVLVGTTIYSAILSAGQPLAPMDQYLAITAGNPFDVSRAVATTLGALVPFEHPPVVDSLQGEIGLGLAFAWGVLLAGTASAGVFAAVMGSRTFALCAAGILLLILSPVMVYLGQYAAGLYFEYPQRYSYCAIPVLAAGLGAWRLARSTLLGVLGLVSAGAFVVLGLVA